MRTRTDITTDQFREIGSTLETPAIAELFVSALSQDYGQRGLDCFIDLAGIYRDEFGSNFRHYSPTEPIEPAEAELVALAVIEWASKPEQVKAYFEQIDRIDNPEAYEQE